MSLKGTAGSGPQEHGDAMHLAVFLLTVDIRQHSMTRSRSGFGLDTHLGHRGGHR